MRIVTIMTFAAMATLISIAQGAEMVTTETLGFKPTVLPRGATVVPSTPEFMRVGEGAMYQCRDGELALFFDARRKGGDHDKAVIRRIVSRDDGRSWQTVLTVLSHPTDSILQPSIVRLPDGRMGMSYSHLKGYKHAEKQFAASSDDGLSWSKPTLISKGECEYVTGAHDRLVQLPTGRIIAILHGKKDVGPGEYDAHFVTYVFTSDDSGATWTNRTPHGLDAPENPFKKKQYGLWEASVVLIGESSRLLLYGRTATGWLFESRSDDSGASWAAPTQTKIPNPLAPVRLTRVPDTPILLMFRNPLVAMESGWHGGVRRVLTVQTSTDEGKNWGPCHQLEFVESETQWFDYPFILWSGTTLHLGYRAPTEGAFACSIYHLALFRDEILKLSGQLGPRDGVPAAHDP